jgi:hypothetical protein
MATDTTTQTLATKAGVSKKDADKTWSKVKTSVIGAKLLNGKIIPADSTKWTPDMWTYALGAFKQVKKETVMSDAMKLIESVVKGRSVKSITNRIIGNRLKESGPGKFEGQSDYVEYFWDRGMDGGADEDWGDVEQGGAYMSFTVTPEDIAKFPELEGRTRVVICDDSQGFVSEADDDYTEEEYYKEFGNEESDDEDIT